MKWGSLKCHHIGIPARKNGKGKEYLPEHNIFHPRYESRELGIEWMYYEDNRGLPEIVWTMPHIAFEVANLSEAI